MIEPNGDSTEVQAIVPAGQLATLMRSEIDTQISTAKAYPRSLKTFKRRALDMATLDEETASSCMYALPRGGKSIQGPSVRLAEIVASAWGNLRYGARIVNDDGKIVTAQGVCHDLETNVCSTIENSRGVTYANGKRYSNDMVVMTQNAASSIAIRNAIFKVIPMAYVREIYQQARLVAIGKAETLAVRRAAAIDYFVKAGVLLERILAAVGKPSVEDIGLDELVILKGAASAVKNGELSLDDAFPEHAKAESNGSRAEELKSKLNGEPKKADPIDQNAIDEWKQSAQEATDFDLLDRLDREFAERKERMDAPTADAVSKIIADQRKRVTEARSGKAKQRVNGVA